MNVIIYTVEYLSDGNIHTNVFKVTISSDLRKIHTLDFDKLIN